MRPEPPRPGRASLPDSTEQQRYADQPGRSRTDQEQRRATAPDPVRPVEESAPGAVAVRRSRTRTWLLLAACLVVLALVGAGLVAARPSALFGTAAHPTAAPTTSEPAPPPVLAAADSDAPAPSAATIEAALTGLLADPNLGPHVRVSVVDASTGSELFANGPTDAMIPASTNKLTTAAAVLAARGGAYRIPTRVVAGANPGEVVIIGGGDPTLAAGKPTYAGAALLSDLAAQVKRVLGGTAPTKVIVDSSLFVGPSTAQGWDPDDLASGQTARITALMTDGGRSNPTKNSARFAKPDLAAGQAFARLLGLSNAAAVRAPRRWVPPPRPRRPSPATPARPAARWPRANSSAWCTRRRWCGWSR